jgi:hypothetical protein
MIQSTNRLSRGARLRRAQPLWFYGVVAALGVLAVGSFIFLKL